MSVDKEYDTMAEDALNSEAWGPKGILYFRTEEVLRTLLCGVPYYTIIMSLSPQSQQSCGSTPSFIFSDES